MNGYLNMKKKLVEINDTSSRSSAGQKAQDEFTRVLAQQVQGLEKTIQLEVEPNVDTIINRLNKKDKKKIN